MKKSPHDLILLYSGGLDSTLLLEMAIRDHLFPLCLSFNYGQKHQEELEYAANYCKRYNLPNPVVRIWLDITSKLTNDVGEVYDGVSSWHVPSRNLIFIAMAASIAECEGIELIWYGANYDDRENLFPDCYQEWIYQMNKLLAINGSSKVRLEAPLLGMTKETIQRRIKDFGIKNNQIFSGYGE